MALGCAIFEGLAEVWMGKRVCVGMGGGGRAHATVFLKPIKVIQDNSQGYQQKAIEDNVANIDRDERSGSSWLLKN